MFRIYENATAPAGTSHDISLGTACPSAALPAVDLNNPNCEYYVMQFLFSAAPGGPCNFAVWFKAVGAAYDENTDLAAGSWGYAGTVGGDGILRTASLPALAAGMDYRLLVWWGFRSNPAGPILVMDDTNTMRFTLQGDRVGFNNCNPIAAALATEARPATFTVGLQPRCLDNGLANCTFAGPPPGTFNCNDPSVNPVGLATVKRVVAVSIGGVGAASLPTCP